jgi:Xaa-Pro dipeptidase
VDRDILERHRIAMAHHGLDAMVAFSKENVAYGAGYIVPSQHLGVRNRQFAVAVNRDGNAAMLVTANELQEAQARTSISDLRTYDEFSEDPMRALVDLLGDLGVADGKIGLEMDGISADRWEALRNLIPRAHWVSGTGAYQEARMIKTPMELEKLRKAARIADLAQAQSHPHVHEGMTEKELYRVIVDRALANGAENILMIQVATAERSSYSNPTPSDRRMRRGDVIKIDLFITEGGYMSDTGRAIVIGEATPQQRQTWANMQAALSAVHGVVSPGATTADLWRVFVDSFASHGMAPIIKFLGHGLGLSLHEEPFISAQSSTVLEPGMVFAIEPVYRIGDIGFHLEDNVIVTAQGMENMTPHFGPELLVVGA